ncbi:MAG: redoxin family protein [Planctomycetaceae bacterium]|nr:redoxin family protein [Planctomycetaceae bacterium]
MRGVAILALAATLPLGFAAAAELPSADQALKQYLPIHRDVDIDRPTADEAANCKIFAKKIDGVTAVLVESPDGIVLRSFVDADGNGVVDQWRYYKDGLEVYRDVDSDGNNRADQYRWFHGAGSRWGIDRDEDGKTDAWKVISAEEVTAEIVAALATRDPSRFARVALTPAELGTLGLGAEKENAIQAKIADLEKQFSELAQRQKVMTTPTKWMQFSASRPGIVPAGTAGSKKDLQVYENVVAITETDGKHGQVQIGTLIRVGDAWRAIQLPSVAENGQEELAASGEFFNKPPTIRQPDMPATAPSDALQTAMSELQELDARSASTTDPGARAKFHEARATLLERIVGMSTTAEDKAMWVSQLADTVSAAVQQGEYDAGVQRLDALLASLKKTGEKNLEAYVAFRKMSAEYGLKMQNAGPTDFGTIHEQWLKNLEEFAKAYPECPDTAEAMLQLAMAHEFAGDEDQAKEWYDRIVADFSQASQARKAAGAKMRLESVGNVIKFNGKATDGKTVDLSGYRGSVVVIQYWASWCEPCKADMTVLKDLAIRYGKKGFQVLGVNLDSSSQEMKSYLGQNPLPWQQIHEEGGLDSRPANELGIHTLPTMILIDQDGRVVNRNVHVAELDTELRRLIR